MGFYAEGWVEASEVVRALRCMGYELADEADVLHRRVTLTPVGDWVQFSDTPDGLEITYVEVM